MAKVSASGEPTISNEGPVLDGDGNPVNLPEDFEVNDDLRAFFAGRVPASGCPHYVYKSEARIGIDTCERC